MRALIVTLGVLVLMPAVTFSQPERYELGQRLKAFEKEWDKQTDPAARKRTLAILPKVTEKFFAFQLGEAGRVLDQARWALTSDKPMPDDVAWAWSLYVRAQNRIVRPTEGMTFEIKPLYPVKADRPDDLEVTIRFGVSRSRLVVTEPSAKITFTQRDIEGDTIERGARFQMPINPFDDMHAKIEIRSRGNLQSTSSLALCRPLFGSMLPPADFVAPTEKVPRELLESASFAEWNDIWKRVTNGEVLETDYSLTALQNHIRWVADNKQRYFTAARSGDFWLAFPTGKDQRTPARVFIPEKLDTKTQVPLVVALHGMGGSENLFFEGYGDGQIVKLCKERGWLLVAPRCPLFGTAPVAEIVEQLSKRYPVDVKRVYLVGHSMGAAQSVDLVQQHPKLFAGVALLGGGGRVKDAKPFTELPTFLGIGTKDQIAFGMAKDLNKTLTAAKAGKLLYKKYEDLEHLVIVREALPDAFKMFDTVK